MSTDSTRASNEWKSMTVERVGGAIDWFYEKKTVRQQVIAGIALAIISPFALPVLLLGDVLFGAKNLFDIAWRWSVTPSEPAAEEVKTMPSVPNTPIVDRAKIDAFVEAVFDDVMKQDPGQAKDYFNKLLEGLYGDIYPVATEEPKSRQQKKETVLKHFDIKMADVPRMEDFQPAFERIAKKRMHDDFIQGLTNEPGRAMLELRKREQILQSLDFKEIDKLLSEKDVKPVRQAIADLFKQKPQLEVAQEIQDLINLTMVRMGFPAGAIDVFGEYEAFIGKRLGELERMREEVNVRFDLLRESPEQSDHATRQEELRRELKTILDESEILREEFRRLQKTQVPLSFQEEEGSGISD